jgi:hypothetical protein
MAIPVTVMTVTVMGPVAITGLCCRRRKRADADQSGQRQGGAS